MTDLEKLWWDDINSQRDDIINQTEYIERETSIADVTAGIGPQLYDEEEIIELMTEEIRQEIDRELVERITREAEMVNSRMR